MPDKVSYEHGARKLMAQDTSDPNDEFSQKAAENRKPALGVGLTEKADPKKKPPPDPADKEAPSKPGEHDRPPRDTREAPAPNPDGKPERTVDADG